MENKILFATFLKGSGNKTKSVSKTATVILSSLEYRLLSALALAKLIVKKSGLAIDGTFDTESITEWYNTTLANIKESKEDNAKELGELFANSSVKQLACGFINSFIDTQSGIARDANVIVNTAFAAFRPIFANLGVDFEGNTAMALAFCNQLEECGVTCTPEELLVELSNRFEAVRDDKAARSTLRHTLKTFTK